MTGFEFHSREPFPATWDAGLSLDAFVVIARMDSAVLTKWGEPGESGGPAVSNNVLYVAH